MSLGAAASGAMPLWLCATPPPLAAAVAGAAFVPCVAVSTQRMTWFFISLITIFTSYIIAVMLPLFDLLSMILGALCGAPIVFGWPAIFYLVACKRKGISMSCFDTFMCYSYLFFFLPLFVIFGAAGKRAALAV